MDKVSIVIPVYNTEKYLERSLSSVIKQTYADLEIIIINDCSSDGSSEIIEKYRSMDDRIKVYTNETNLGAYHVRIQGMEYASGKYIGFLDSDDYIGLDFVRLLIKKAIAGDFDIVTSATVHCNKDKSKFVLPEHEKAMKSMPLFGEEILNRYFGQQGKNYIWHVIWNKIYKLDLIKRALPYLKEMKDHLIMTEDIIISTILISQSCSMDHEEHSVYYYCRNEDSATSMEEITFEEYEKKFGDVVKVFDFTADYIKKINIGKKYEDDFHIFRRRYGGSWEGIISKLKSDREKAFSMIEAFCTDRIYEKNKDDREWEVFQDRLEKIKNRILNKDYKYISFSDIERTTVRELMDMAEFTGKQIIDENDLKNRNRLHIGSDFYSDFIKSKMDNIETVFYPEPYEADPYKKTGLKELLFGKEIATKKILLWGTGDICSYLIQRFGVKDIYGFVDSDIEKTNKSIEGIPIISPEHLKEISDYYVIIACGAIEEVGKQLRNLKNTEFKDYISYDNII